MEQVDIVGRLLDIKKFYDVRVLNSLHDFDFVLEGLVEFFGILLDVGSRDGFDGDQTAVSDICALEDLAVRAPAYLFVDVDDERLYELIVGSAELGRFQLYLLHLALLHLISIIARVPTQLKTARNHNSHTIPISQHLHHS